MLSYANSFHLGSRAPICLTEESLAIDRVKSVFIHSLPKRSLPIVTLSTIKNAIFISQLGYYNIFNKIKKTREKKNDHIVGRKVMLDSLFSWQTKSM